MTPIKSYLKETHAEIYSRIICVVNKNNKGEWVANGFPVENLSTKSNKIVSIPCINYSSCGNVKYSSVCNLVAGKLRCKDCSFDQMKLTKLITIKYEESVDYLYPIVAQSFIRNETKPGRLPIHFSPGVDDHCWWDDLCGHGEYLLRVNSRCKGRGCPRCAKLKGNGSSRLELQLFNIIAGSTRYKTALGVKFPFYPGAVDFFIPKLKIAIDFDGEYWHRDKFEIDRLKCRAFKENGVLLLKIRPRSLKSIPKHTVRISNKNANNSISIYLEIFKEICKYIPNLKELPTSKLHDIVNEATKEYNPQLNGEAFVCPPNIRYVGDLDLSNVSKSSGLSGGFECLICKYEWSAFFYSIQSGQGCPKCGRTRVWVTRFNSRNQPMGDYMVKKSLIAKTSWAGENIYLGTFLTKEHCWVAWDLFNSIFRPEIISNQQLFPEYDYPELDPIAHNKVVNKAKEALKLAKAKQ